MVSTVRPIGTSPREDGNPFITTRGTSESSEILGGQERLDFIGYWDRGNCGNDRNLLWMGCQVNRSDRQSVRSGLKSGALSRKETAEEEVCTVPPSYESFPPRFRLPSHARSRGRRAGLDLGDIAR